MDDGQRGDNINRMKVMQVRFLSWLQIEGPSSSLGDSIIGNASVVPKIWVRVPRLV